MSHLPRFYRQFWASRRAYSSFFSSKPGGGRYAKTPKTVATTGAAAGKGKVETRPSPAPDSVDGVHGPTRQTKDESSSSSRSPSASNALSSPRDAEAPTAAPSSTSSTASSPAVMPFSSDHPLPIPSVLNPHDYKLHQFFSLHRPLLLISQSSNILFETSSPSTSPLFSQLLTGHPPPPPAHIGTLDDPPEASPEADADTARQLTRTLVMNRVGETITWEAALRRLGMDVEQEAGRIESKEKMEREWEEVLLDSTKRKRRKKMRKHKLKKRRKATRAQRLKIGR